MLLQWATPHQTCPIMINKAPNTTNYWISSVTNMIAMITCLIKVVQIAPSTCKWFLHSTIVHKFALSFIRLILVASKFSNVTKQYTHIHYHISQYIRLYFICRTCVIIVQSRWGWLILITPALTRILQIWYIYIYIYIYIANIIEVS